MNVWLFHRRNGGYFNVFLGWFHNFPAQRLWPHLKLQLYCSALWQGLPAWPVHGSQKFSPPSVILVWIQIYFHSRIFLCSLAEGQKYQIIQQIQFQNMQNLHLFCATLAFITFKIATICIDSWTKPIMHQLRRKGERSRKFKVLTVESLAESNEAWSRDLPCLLNNHLPSSITGMSHLNCITVLQQPSSITVMQHLDSLSHSQYIWSPLKWPLQYWSGNYHALSNYLVRQLLSTQLASTAVLQMCVQLSYTK